MILTVSGKLGSGKDTVGQIIQYLIWKKRVEAGLSPLSGISFSDFGNKPLAERYSGWEIKKYASNLKIIASILTGIPVEKFEDQEFKKTYLPEIWDYNTEFEGGTVRARMTVREFLQRLGTDAMRNGLHPNTWANAFWKDYKPKGDCSCDPTQGFCMCDGSVYPNWIITDVRFSNELEAAKERNAITVRVERPMGSSKFEGTQEEWDKLVQKNKQASHPSETSLDHITDWDYVIHNCGTIDELIKKVEIILLTERIL